MNTENVTKTAVGFFLIFLLGASSVLAGADLTRAATNGVSLAPEVLAALDASKSQLLPPVKEAFLASAKARALAELRTAGQEIPDAFLRWIDAKSDVYATVYGARREPAPVLRLLYSLELDLGPEVVREQYTQLALATAITHARRSTPVDLTPRPRLTLVIPGDPRKPVDTKDPKRTLDVYDHIINFLEDHAPIEEDVVVGQREEPPELKYDARGIALPAGKPRKVPVTEKQKRPLIAADVFEKRALQEEFNAYMASRGFTNRIDCGDGIIHRNSHDMIRGPEAAGIRAAYQLFRTAYEAKGRLPAARDPEPSPAEKMAFLIRNDRYRFPDELQANRKWPRFPLNAPWPVLTLLAEDNQPLREREDIWVKFRDEGKMRTYGEYIGGIAQQFDMQSARRLSPYPFSYGTFQMMCKDGGVCGTMANMGVRTDKALGIPACTAGQPGHCALIQFSFDPKTGLYRCHGGQYATGGDAQTHPHAPWYFGDTDRAREMVYHQSIAWAVNHGMSSYLDSTIAYTICQQMTAEQKSAHATPLLASGLRLNPFNILLLDAATENTATPDGQIAVWQTVATGMQLGGAKAGCPSNSLYTAHLNARTFARIGVLPLPADTAAVQRAYAFLRRENCDAQKTMVKYQVGFTGLDALRAQFRAELTNYFATVSTRHTAQNDIDGRNLADRFSALAERMSIAKARRDWATDLLSLTSGHEKYFGARYRVTTDPVVAALYKTAGRKMAPDADLLAAVLDRLVRELETAVAGTREVASSRVLAARISAAGQLVKDAAALASWHSRLAGVITGKEMFTPAGAKKNAKPVRDPCADAIAKLVPASRS